MTNVKKILVVALDNIGDVVMATSVFSVLKRVRPNAKIGFWTKAYAAGLFHDQSLIDYLHASDPFWDKSPGHGKGRASDFFRVLSEIRRVKYDAALVLNAEWRRALACWAAGIPERIGYNRRQSDSFLTQAFPAPTGERHFVDDHRTLVELWTGETLSAEDAVPRIELSEKENKWWTGWAAEKKMGDKNYTVIHPFSGDEDKNWPLSCWAELIERRLASDKNERFVLAMAPSELPRLSAFSSVFGRPEVAPLGVPDLACLKAVLAHARFFAGGDSGPGHVAAALGVPVLSLFGPTRPERSRPMGRDAVQVIKHDPLRMLPVDRVLSEMEALPVHV